MPSIIIPDAFNLGLSCYQAIILISVNLISIHLGVHILISYLNLSWRKFEYCQRKYIVILHTEHEISNPCSKPQGILSEDIPSSYLSCLRCTQIYSMDGSRKVVQLNSRQSLTDLYLSVCHKLVKEIYMDILCTFPNYLNIFSHPSFGENEV